MPCYATAVLNADNSQDPLKNDRQRSGDNNKKEKSDTCNTDLFCRSLSVIEWIFSGSKSAAAKLKGWSLEYDHDSKSRITWSFFSLANRQILYEIPMITVMWLYLVASSYLSFFLSSQSWIVRTSSTASLKSVATKKNYQVIYIVNQFTIYAALFFMIFMLSIASEVVLWLGMKGFSLLIWYVNSFSLEFVRPISHDNWYNERYQSRIVLVK